MSGPVYNAISRISKINNIVPCQRYMCICVEYLDFGKTTDFNKYKHCHITYRNNVKYYRNDIK